jgi:hypothetical protein
MTFVLVMTLMGMDVCTHRRRQHWWVNLPTKAKPMSVKIKDFFQKLLMAGDVFDHTFQGLACSEA